VAAQPGWYDDATVPAQPGWHDHATTAAEPGGDDPAEADAAPSGATPVFVDDSGRRRRWGRIVGVGLGVVVLAYVAVVGLTFAGVQLAGTLAPPGVDDLLEPAGERPAGVGPGAEESPLPPEAFDPDADPAGAAATTDPASDEADASPTTDQGADASTTAATTTTTVATTSTTAPSPNATVPDHTRPTTANGPPDEPPGKP
jgi:hypothetical protein